MLGRNEFERWIEALHTLFEVFCGNDNKIYSLATKWIQEWFSCNKFTVEEKDAEFLEHLIQNFNYDAFRDFRNRIERDDNTWKNLVSKADQQFRRLRENNLKPGKCENVGFAVAPFLFTWNFQRFKEYFKNREDFDLEQYFTELGEFLESKKGKLEFFRTRELVVDRIEEEKVEEIFKEINTKLRELGMRRKQRQNEPVGTIKLLHLFAPYYFPLIDNKIAKATGLLRDKQKKSIESTDYIRWMNKLKDWLQNYDVIDKLQNKFNSSILKLVDECLYLMCSVKLCKIAELGLKM